MKKLLALILCVMMFVAVIPTAAFADTVYTANSGWASKSASKDAIDSAKDNIEAAYGALVADKTVYGTVQAIDGIITSMAKGFFADLEDGATLFDVDFTQDNLIDGTKGFLRSVIGEEICKEMDKKFVKWFDTDTKKIDPLKYMEVFASAASKAFTSDKAQKAIEDLAYELAWAQVIKSVTDDLDDMYDDVDDWILDNTDFYKTYFNGKNPFTSFINADGDVSLGHVDALDISDYQHLNPPIEAAYWEALLANS